MTFGKEVRYFGADVLTVTPSTGTSFNSFTEVSADVYTLNFVPGAEGEYVIAIAEDTVEDLFANLNTASNDLTFTFDTTPPTTTLASAEFTQYTNTFPITVTVTYSEAVVAPVVADFAITGTATAANVAAVSTSVYTVELEPTDQGDFSVLLAADHTTDLALNTAGVSNSLDFHYDTVRPTVALTTTADTLSEGTPLVIRTSDYPIPIAAAWDQVAP